MDLEAFLWEIQGAVGKRIVLCIYWKTARRRGFYLCVHAGLCLFSSRRRAFFFPFLLWLGRLESAGGDFASVCTLAPAFLRLAGVHFSLCFSASLDVSNLPAGILPPFARWPLLFTASPACIFLPVSPPAWTSRRCRRAICLCVHAGHYLSSSRRRAFFILFLRQLGCFDDAGGDFASVCTLASAVPRFAGVHFSSRFSASLGVSTVTAGILPLCARWPSPFFASPACIFHSVSPPAWAFRRWWRGFCLLLHAGLCLSSYRRRAFFILFLRRLGRFDCDGRDFASVCTLAFAFLRLTGVHFLFCFSASLAVSTVTAGILPPFARWPLPFFISPACIFYPVSPPAWTSRHCRPAISLCVHAGLCLSSPHRRAFFFPFLRQLGRLDCDSRDFTSVCTLVPCLSSPPQRAFFFPFLLRLDRLDDAGGQ